jgi:hypothetical protein
VSDCELFLCYSVSGQVDEVRAYLVRRLMDVRARRADIRMAKAFADVCERGTISKTGGGEVMPLQRHGWVEE